MSFAEAFQRVINLHESKETFQRLCLAAIMLAAQDGFADQDKLREETDSFLEPDESRSVYGSVWGYLLQRGVFVRIGRKQSDRNTSNGRCVNRYRLTSNWRSALVKNTKMKVNADVLDIVAKTIKPGSVIWSQEDVKQALLAIVEQAKAGNCAGVIALAKPVLDQFNADDEEEETQKTQVLPGLHA